MRTALADLLRGDHAHVNLIPMNQVAHTPWQASPMPVIESVRGRPDGGRDRHDDPAQPRPGGRGRLRPAGGRAGRGAARARRRPPSRAPRARERRRAARRAQRRARAGDGRRVAMATPSAAGREAGRGTGRALIAASILDADLGNLAQRRAARDARGRRPRPPRRHGRPLRPEPDVRREDDQGAAAADPGARSTPT